MAVPVSTAPCSNAAAAHPTAIEPMVVAAFGTLLPFIDCSNAAFGCHPILGRQMLSKHAMMLRHATE